MKCHRCIFSFLAVFAFGGCVLAPTKEEKSVLITNTHEEVQIWDVVIETRQRVDEQEIPLQIEMQGRMKWLRAWNKYCCSSRVRERWGSWFVWMYYEDGKLSYPPVEHPAARPTNILDQCNNIYAHISVPKRGALAKEAYFSIQSDMRVRQCNSESDWNGNRKREIASYTHEEKHDMKGEVRLRVKLFRNSSLRIASKSDSVLSLSAEQCDRNTVRLFIDKTREPQWEDWGLQSQPGQGFNSGQ